MSKPKRTDERSAGKPDHHELVHLIKAQAHILGRALETGLSGARREKVERHLEQAWELLHPMQFAPSARGGSWSLTALQTHVIGVFDAAAERIKSDESGEDDEIERVAYQISMMMDDKYSPPEQRGRVLDANLVRACLRACLRGRGKPRKGERVPSKEDATLQVFKALGIASGSGEAVKKLRQRAAAKTRRRKA